MKSANLTAAQIKEQETEGVDSVGELVAMCEKDGFIPRYYIDTPKDKVDRVIQDMQEYTRSLVIDELGLGNLIENGIQSLQKEREAIQGTVQGDGLTSEAEEDLFNYNAGELSDQDFIDYAEAEENGEI